MNSCQCRQFKPYQDGAICCCSCGTLKWPEAIAQPVVEEIKKGFYPQALHAAEYQAIIKAHWADVSEMRRLNISYSVIKETLGFEFSVSTLSKNVRKMQEADAPKIIGHSHNRKRTRSDGKAFGKRMKEAGA